jgi:hypothetical protein
MALAFNKIPQRFLSHPPNHWDPPPAPPIGNRSVRVIHEAVGNALSQWEWVEYFLAGIFHTLIESHSHAAKRAYGILTGSPVKADSIREASAVFFMFHQDRFSEEDQSALAKLLGSYREASARRNDIAHGWPVYIKIDNKSKGTFLQAPDYNTRRTNPIKFRSSLGSSYSYSKSEIMEITEKFTKFAEQIMQYNLYLYHILHQRLMPLFPVRSTSCS